MKVEQKGHTTIIKDTKLDLVNFIATIHSQINTFSQHNLIIDLHAYDNLLLKDILLFSDFAKEFKKSKKSIILVVPNFDYNANTKKITVVPSILEAHDIIEMEEIERDLGF